MGDSATAGDKHINAFLYSEGKMIDLGNLGGNRSYATCINNEGDVAGDIEGPGRRVFYYTPQGGMQDMERLCSKFLVEAKSGKKGFTYVVDIGGINSQGDMTGIGSFWDGSRNTMQAFLYRSADHSLARLSSP